jgi:hypothetical protein
MYVAATVIYMEISKLELQWYYVCIPLTNEFQWIALLLFNYTIVVGTFSFYHCFFSNSIAYDSLQIQNFCFLAFFIDMNAFIFICS